MEFNTEDLATGGGQLKAPKRALSYFNESAITPKVLTFISVRKLQVNTPQFELLDIFTFHGSPFETALAAIFLRSCSLAILPLTKELSLF